jgi:hypothetical protein
MGYTTEFTGSVAVVPPLNLSEITYLRKFNETRRMSRTRGPYYVGGGGYMGQDREEDVLDYNNPDPTQPGLWCKWMPTEGGDAIEWDGNEKFYCSEEWMVYLIDHFLKLGAAAASSGEQQFTGFTFDHVVNGVIEAQGEDADDMWRLVVKDNVVSSVKPTITWPDPSPVVEWPERVEP